MFDYYGNVQHGALWSHFWTLWTTLISLYDHFRIICLVSESLHPFSLFNHPYWMQIYCWNLHICTRWPMRCWEWKLNTLLEYLCMNCLYPIPHPMLHCRVFSVTVVRNGQYLVLLSMYDCLKISCSTLVKAYAIIIVANICPSIFLPPRYSPIWLIGMIRGDHVDVRAANSDISLQWILVPWYFPLNQHSIGIIPLTSFFSDSQWNISFLWHHEAFLRLGVLNYLHCMFCSHWITADEIIFRMLNIIVCDCINYLVDCRCYQLKSRKSNMLSMQYCVTQPSIGPNIHLIHFVSNLNNFEPYS